MQSNEAQQLRKHLFKQLERLEDPSLDLATEMKRADALAKVGTVIVNSHKQEVDLMKLDMRKPVGAKTIKLKASHKTQRQVANG